MKSEVREYIEQSGFSRAVVEHLRATSLRLAQDDPAKCIKLIEDAALNVLKTEKQDDLSDLPFAVAHSQFTALGVLLYRSALPLLPRKEAERSYDMMKTFREGLKLPPDDPAPNV